MLCNHILLMGFEEVTMRQPEQIALLKRLLHFVETKTTCMAETPYRNPVTTYTDPARLLRERHGFRRSQSPCRAL